MIQKIKPLTKGAFDKLFFKYYKPLYRFAFHLCNNVTFAEESVQKTFIRIWQNNTNSSEEDIGNLLFAYTKNAVIDEIRKDQTRKKYEVSSSHKVIINENHLDQGKYCVKALIENAIEQLPKRSKEIFRLAKKEGLSVGEIAVYLKISKKTVENQLTIAYKKIRLYLEPYKNQIDFWGDKE